MSEQANRALAEALRLAEHGYALTPVTITRAATGKKAARFHKGWRHESSWSSDPEVIRAWWVDHPDTSFALGGGANGIEGVDLDVKPELGIDAVTDWASRGLPVSPFMQWTPSGGCHLIWRVRDDGQALPQEAGRTMGKGIDTRNRAGLFFAAGAYVLGEAGHYEIEGALPKLADLPVTPGEVLDLFAHVPERAERPVDGRIVTHDEAWQRAQVHAALTAVREHERNEGGYRAKLQHAGLFLGRAAEQGFLTVEAAEAQLLDAHRSVWGPTVYAENVKDVRDAIADGPRLERWRVPAPLPTIERPSALAGPATVSASVTELPTDADLQADAWLSSASAADSFGLLTFEDKVAREVERQDIRDAANAARAARDRKPLRRMSAAEFLAAPQPTYLVPGLLYEDSLAVVFGPPGAAKTFFTLDLALSLATGRAWRGEVMVPRTRVHYLMAEGQAVNVGRTHAWLVHHGVAEDRLDGWFDAFPEPLALTPEGVADYLREVELDRPGLIILDTKHAMMEGDESKAADVKVLRDALTLIRQATGACVLLVDHTGLADDTRARGSNSQKAMVATEIRLSESGGIRTAEIMRNTAGEVGASWSFELRPVPDAPRPPGLAVPVVPMPADARRLALAALHDTCWDIRRGELPEAVASLPGAMGEAACDVFRAMVAANDQDGMTVPTIRGLLGDSPREHGRTQVYAAVAKLGEIGVLEPVPTARKNWLLASKFVGWAGPDAS